MWISESPSTYLGTAKRERQHDGERTWLPQSETFTARTMVDPPKCITVFV